MTSVASCNDPLIVLGVSGLGPSPVKWCSSDLRTTITGQLASRNTGTPSSAGRVDEGHRLGAEVGATQASGPPGPAAEQRDGIREAPCVADYTWDRAGSDAGVLSEAIVLWDRATVRTIRSRGDIRGPPLQFPSNCATRSEEEAT